MVRWPTAVLRLRRLIRKLRPDLVHTTLTEAYIIGGVAGRLVGVPVMSTLVNAFYGPEWLIDNPRFTRVKMGVMKALASSVYRGCHRAHVAISKFVADSYVRGARLGPERIRIIYRSLPEDWAPSGELLPPAPKVPDAYPLLLNVGRLMPQKGHRYLIEAMPLVIERFPRAQLLIA